MNYTIVKDRNQFIVTINEIADAKFIKELISFLEGETEEVDKLCDKFLINK